MPFATFTPLDFSQAAQAFQESDLETAHAILEKLLHDNPESSDLYQLQGLIAYQKGEYHNAIVALKHAILLSSQRVEFYTSLGAAYRAVQLFQDAEAVYIQALQLDPYHIDTLRNFANLLIDIKQLQQAAQLLEKIQKIQPHDRENLLRLGDVHYHLQQFEKAATAYQPILDDDPNHEQAIARLVLALQAGEQLDRLENLFKSRLSINPHDVEVLVKRAAYLAGRGRFVEAAQDYAICCTLKPDNADIWSEQAEVFRRLGKPLDAEHSARHALTLNPDHVSALNNLGNALVAQNRTLQAESAFDAALKIAPHYAAALSNRGLSYLKRGRIIEAEQDFQAALAAAPHLPEIGFNLGTALMDQARFEEAEAAYRAALKACPHKFTGHGSLLFCLNYKPYISGEEVLAEYKNWDAVHAAQFLPPLNRVHLGAPVPDHDPNLTGFNRILRIGYVSPDFKAKSANYFIEPILQEHNRANVEIFLYAEVSSPDHVTERFKKIADHWRPTSGLSDDQMATLIRDDKIDILIDLGGHTADNRLLALARKPAPIQIAYLLGHGYSSGMGAMDVFLADSALVPDGMDDHFSEQVVRLSRIPIVYQPPSTMPEVAPLPALEKKHITFGCFSRLVRINEQVVETWAKILHAVPQSRLMLNAMPLAEDKTRALFTNRFAEHGISEDRLDLVFTHPQSRTWDAYGQIDIALDPFPHNAGTTTIEALWLGVPVISKRDRPSIGRFGASILEAVEMGEWAVETEQDYINQAIKASSDLHKLSDLRQSLRKRFKLSPLYDAKGLVQEMEAVYRTLWTQHCGTQPCLVRLQTLFAAQQLLGAEQEADRLIAAHLHQGEAFQAKGLIAYLKGHYQQAVNDLQHSLTFKKEASTYSNLGAALRKLGLKTQAEAAYRQALELAPDFVDALANLGNLFIDNNRPYEALEVLQSALQLKPSDPKVLRSYGLCLLTKGDVQQAVDHLQKAVALYPQDGDLHETCGAALRQVGLTLQAEHHHRLALPLVNDKYRTLSNLAVALQDQVRLSEAQDTFQAALALKPDYRTAHANLLFCLNYQPDIPAEEIFKEYQAFDKHFCQPCLNILPPLKPDLNINRPLRIGYLSPDFREHSVSLFSEPLIAAHNKNNVHITLYAEISKIDTVSERFKTLCDQWVETKGLSDQQLAQHIRNDNIDILIDLGGHTSSSRLQAMAYRAAPVQVAYLVGHGATSGMSMVDMFLSDPHLVPKGYEHLFSETIVRLPRIPIVYQPPQVMPEVAPLPALHNGFVTFGCFSRLERINHKVIALWTRVLKAVPKSRLMLNAKPFQEAAFRDSFAARFAEHGIARERLNLVYTSPQPVTWDAYGQIDIALDPFPHNAGTTTIEALWLGVPVISLKDRPSVGRFGVSILEALGLGEWALDTQDAYVEKAVQLASDIKALSHMRHSLRERFEMSPLLDAQGLARNIEEVYKKVWANYCENNNPDLILQNLYALFAAGDLANADNQADLLLKNGHHMAQALQAKGLIAYKKALFQDAITHFEASLSLQVQASTLSNLGAALRATGDVQRAETVYRQAIALKPDFGDAWGNLGNILMDQNRLKEACTVFETALIHKPQDATLLVNYGQALHRQGRLLKALATYKSALERDPKAYDACKNAGSALASLMRHHEARAMYAKALKINPSPDVYSSYLFNLNYAPDLNADDIAGEYQKFNTLYGETSQNAVPIKRQFKNSKIRIGYVSPDLCSHVVAAFLEPILRHHDRNRFDIFCYGDVLHPDHVTQRIARQVDGLRLTNGLSDQRMAELIRNDGIDILIDCAGHSARNRLMVFARKPAPYQLSYLIGHGTTTGLSAIDGFLADYALVPEGYDRFFSETIIRLPRIPLAFEASHVMPDVAPLPALSKGFVTFGCFSRTVRLNEKVLETWGKILNALPTARLVLNASPFDDQNVRDYFYTQIKALHLPVAQIDLVYTSPQTATWAAYGDIDISLDPFPHNAGTTTIEALWFGVPVVSLKDRPSVGRLGASILEALDMGDWAVDSEQTYIEKAVHAATNIQELSDLRESLRQRFKNSPLGNSEELTKELEKVYERLHFSKRS